MGRGAFLRPSVQRQLFFPLGRIIVVVHLTPFSVVDYRVDESLKAHLTRKLEEAHAETRRRGGDENDADGKLERVNPKG